VPTTVGVVEQATVSVLSGIVSISPSLRCRPLFILRDAQHGISRPSVDLLIRSIPMGRGPQSEISEVQLQPWPVPTAMLRRTATATATAEIVAHAGYGVRHCAGSMHIYRQAKQRESHNICVYSRPVCQFPSAVSSRAPFVFRGAKLNVPCPDR
jgi:hypothetical protein